MADPGPKTPSDIEHRTKPLSQTASKLLVVFSILFIIGATIGGSYYLVSVTSSALDAPADSASTPDSTEQLAPAPDTAAVQP